MYVHEIVVEYQQNVIPPFPFTCKGLCSIFGGVRNCMGDVDFCPAHDR